MSNDDEYIDIISFPAYLYSFRWRMYLDVIANPASGKFRTNPSHQEAFGSTKLFSNIVTFIEVGILVELFKYFHLELSLNYINNIYLFTFIFVLIYVPKEYFFWNMYIRRMRYLAKHKSENILDLPKCPQCGRQFSESKDTCPYCSIPLAK